MRARGLRIVLLSVVLAVELGAGARAAPVVSTLPLEPIGGGVEALAVDGGTAYLGGSFLGFGSALGGLLVTDPVRGARDASWPLSPGQVDALVADGSGGAYVAGDMSVGGVARHGVFHLLAGKTLDPAFVVPVSGTVRALRTSGSRLYLGGDFTSVAGDAGHPNVASVDAGTGALDTAFDPDPDGPVDALAAVSTLAAGCRTSSSSAGSSPVSAGPQDRRGTTSPRSA